MDMQGKNFTEEQRAEIKEIMLETLVEYFEVKGALIKNIVVTGAILVGSLTVILGGGKAILIWLGFSYAGK